MSSGAGSRRPPEQWLPVVPFAVVLSADLFFAATETDGTSVAVLTTLAMACFMVGSLAGFLLGMPRYVAAQNGGGDGSRYEPSTSLEQISDWLVKILIGVGIAEATSAVSAIDGLLDTTIVPALGSEPAAYSLAMANVVTGVVAGFYVAWLLTRFKLTKELNKGDVLRNLADAAGTEDEREALLDMADAADRSAQQEKAYEEAALAATEVAASDLGATFEPSRRSWDAFVVKGDCRVGVEVKFTTRAELSRSKIRREAGRLLTDDRTQKALLIANRPPSKGAHDELSKVRATKRYQIKPVHWTEGDDHDEIRAALEDLLT